MANYPRPAQLAQAEEKRQTAYKLYLRGQLEREIAELLHVSQGRVSQYLGQMKDRNVQWYETHSDPKQRRKSLTKEVADQYRDVLREQWIIYGKQEKDGMKTKLLGDITRTLDSYAAKLGLVVPSMDQAWLEDQVRRNDEPEFGRVAVKGPGDVA